MCAKNNNSLINKLVAILFVAIIVLFNVNLAAADTSNKVRKLIALVISNSEYTNVEKLKHSADNADLMSKSLAQLNFEVDVINNVNKDDFNKALDAFVKKASQADKVLFYFSGHGFQLNGENYLLPTNANFDDHTEVSNQAVNLGVIIKKLHDRKRQTFIFLDGYQKSPLPSPLKNSSYTNGFTKIEVASETFVALATELNSATNGNNFFTKALSDQIKTPEMSISDMLEEVKKKVFNQTSGKQKPWAISNLRRQFYFNLRSPKNKIDRISIDKTAHEALKPSLTISLFKEPLESDNTYSEVSINQKVSKPIQPLYTLKKPALKKPKIELVKDIEQPIIATENKKEPKNKTEETITANLYDAELNKYPPTPKFKKSFAEKVATNKINSKKSIVKPKKETVKQPIIISQLDKKNNDFKVRSSQPQKRNNTIVEKSAETLAKTYANLNKPIKTSTLNIEPPVKVTKSIQKPVVRNEGDVKKNDSEALSNLKYTSLELSHQSDVSIFQNDKNNLETLAEEAQSDEETKEAKLDAQDENDLPINEIAPVDNIIKLKDVETQLTPIPDNLPLAIQSELKRLGCYFGAIDGLWGNKSNKALSNYYGSKKSSTYKTEPNIDTYKELVDDDETICKLNQDVTSPAKTKTDTKKKTKKSPASKRNLNKKPKKKAKVRSKTKPKKVTKPKPKKVIRPKPKKAAKPKKKERTASKKKAPSQKRKLTKKLITRF